MSNRRLRLVAPPAGRAAAPFGGGDDDPPFDEAELRAAAAMRDALDVDPVAAGLRAAWAPTDLDPVDHEALLARAFGDDEAPPTHAERLAAGRLRDALDGAATSPDGDLAVALRAAAKPAQLDAGRNEAIVARALAGRPEAAPATARGGRVIRVVFAAAAAITAMAAGFSLLVTTGDEAAPAASRAVADSMVAGALIPARSAAELFDATEPFPRTGGESARIDRIASSRTADLRANRFAAWGVR